MKWTDIALIGGIAIAVGIVAKQTGAGKGLVEVAEGLTEVGVSPFRAAGRGLGELGTGITQFSASIGGIGKGIGEAFAYVTGGLQGLLGLGSAEARTEARPAPPTTTSPYTPSPSLPPPEYYPEYVQAAARTGARPEDVNIYRREATQQVERIISEARMGARPVSEAFTALDLYFAGR